MGMTNLANWHFIVKGDNCMTWGELNKKYPESRDNMDEDRERAFVKDLYDTYETAGFVGKFWSPFNLSSKDQNYVGKPFKVVGRCEENEKFDLEDLPAWIIEFKDGYRIYLRDMLANGYGPLRVEFPEEMQYV